MALHTYSRANGLWVVCVLAILLGGESPAQTKEKPFTRNRHISAGVRLGFNQLGAPFEYRVDKFLIRSPDMNEMYYHAGVFVRKDFNRWFAQSELICSQNVMYVLIHNSAPLTWPYGYIAAGTDFQVIGLTAPVQAGFRPAKWLSLTAGPVLHWHFYERPFASYDPDYRIFDSIQFGFSRLTAGYRLGAGLSYGRFSLDVSWQRRRLLRNIAFDGRRVPFRANATEVSASLGFIFLRR